MITKLDKYITIDPEILGGTPVIAGTRIPIERVKELVRQGYTPATIKEEFPHVGIKKIQDIISFLMEEGLNGFKKAHKVQITP